MGSDFLRVARNADDLARVTRLKPSADTRLAQTHSLQRPVRTDSRLRPSQVPVPAAARFVAAGPLAIYGSTLDPLHKRRLTAAEVKEAGRVFGTALKTEDIWVSEGSLLSAGGYARTLPHHIYFPEGSFQQPDFLPLLIHELTHVWQYQQGYPVRWLVFQALIASYDYGKEDGLREAWERGRSFDDFNTEQQGDILSDYYTKLVAGKDVSAYQGFVDQVRTGRATERRPRSPIEPLPSGKLDVWKLNEQYRAEVEAQIIAQLRLPASAARSSRLLELCHKVGPEWGEKYRDRVAQRRPGDVLINLLFSRADRDIRARMLTILGA